MLNQPQFLAPMGAPLDMQQQLNALAQRNLLVQQ